MVLTRVAEHRRHTQTVSPVADTRGFETRAARQEMRQSDLRERARLLPPLRRLVCLDRLSPGRILDRHLARRQLVVVAKRLDQQHVQRRQIGPRQLELPPNRFVVDSAGSYSTDAVVPSTAAPSRPPPTTSGPAGVNLFARARRSPTGARLVLTCSPPIRGGATTSHSTSTSTATPAWVWAPNTKRAGRPWSRT